jgi:hypothetical protein
MLILIGVFAWGACTFISSFMQVTARMPGPMLLSLFPAKKWIFALKPML